MESTRKTVSIYTERKASLTGVVAGKSRKRGEHELREILSK